MAWTVLQGTDYPEPSPAIERLAARKVRPVMPRAPRNLITIADAAETCNVSSRTIRRRVADGSIRGFRIGPRLLRVDRAEVEKLLKPVPVTGHYGGNVTARARKVLAEALALAEQAEAAGNGA